MRTERWNVKYLICFTIHVILLNVLFWINLIILNDLEMTLKVIKTMYNKHLNESWKNVISKCYFKAITERETNTVTLKMLA